MWWSIRNVDEEFRSVLCTQYRSVFIWTPVDNAVCLEEKKCLQRRLCSDDSALTGPRARWCRWHREPAWAVYSPGTQPASSSRRQRGRNAPSLSPWHAYPHRCGKHKSYSIISHSVLFRSKGGYFKATVTDVMTQRRSCISEQDNLSFVFHKILQKKNWSFIIFLLHVL